MQNLVTILVDPDGKGLVDHWAKTSHAFLTGAVLHVLYKKRAEGKVGCLPDVALALSDPDSRIENLYFEMIANGWARKRRRPPNDRFGRARHDEPPRRGARLGALHRHELPLALSRSAGRQKCGPLRLQGERS